MGCRDESKDAVHLQSSSAARQGRPLSLADEIHARLAALAPESVDLRDESDEHVGHEGARSGGGHYRLTIVSAQFAGRSAVERHRLVYAALGPLMAGRIHALALHAYAPGEI